MTTYVERLFSVVSNALEFNAATLSGAADIIVVEGEDGIRRSMPWNVRFGKLRLLKSREKMVSVFINDKPTDLQLTLDTAGEAYFLAETDQPPPPDLIPSPATEPSSPSRSGISNFVSPDVLSRKLEEAKKPIGEANSHIAEPFESVTYASDSEYNPNFRKASEELCASLKACKRGSQDDLTLDVKSRKIGGFGTKYGATLIPPRREGYELGSLCTESFDIVSSPRRSLDSAASSISVKNPESSSSLSSSPTSWMDSFLRRFSSKKFTSDRPSFESQDPFDSVTADSVALSFSSNDGKYVTDQPEHSWMFEDRQSISDTIPLAENKTNRFDLDATSSKSTSDSKENIQKTEHHITDSLSSCSSSENEKEDMSLLDPVEKKVKNPGFLSLGDGYVSAVDHVNGLVPENRNGKQLPFVQRKSFDYMQRKESENSLSLNGMNSSFTNSFEGHGGLTTGTEELLTSKEWNSKHITNSEFPLILSLCGHLIRPDMPDEAKTNIFEQNRIEFTSFVSDPSILYHPNLLLKIDNKLYTWKEAAPMLVSILAYGIPLDIRTSNSNDKKKAEYKEENTKKRFSWFGFRSSEGSQIIAGEPLISDDILAIVNKDSHPSQYPVLEDSRKQTVTSSSVPSNSNLFERKYYIKTRRPSKEELGKLDLKPGSNDVRFVVNSTLQGIQELSAKIFLWQYDSKIVVSDIDGTITRSDVLGHLLPRVGKDWSHEGIAKLYTLIARNGYKMLYLTSRAIGQATSTRMYIQSLCQDSKFKMPEGPVVMSPDRLVESLTREVIRKRPQEFKIGALRNVRELFPHNYNAFYAGFGNRVTDLISYRMVGIPSSRIFLINWKGELQICNYVYETIGSYRNLQKFVDEIFVDISFLHGMKDKEEAIHETDFNDWNYWKRSLQTWNESDLTNFITSGS